MQEVEIQSGTVRRVFFANPESPFMAGVLVTEEGKEVRFGGKCIAQVGDKLELTGTWKKHPKFGMQFEATSGVVRMDESPEALIHMLSTDARFKGLGPVRARRVVEAALALSSDGELANALRTYTDEIATRANCPLEVVANAADVWNGKRSYFDALARLCEQGWSNAQAQTILDKFGENAPSIVKADPYLLIGRIPRFGFRTVDTIACKMGTPRGCPERIAAGLAYCLDQMSSDGNTWTTREALIQSSREELRPDTLEDEDKIPLILDRLIGEGIVHIDVSPVGTEVVADARLARVEFEVFEFLLDGLKGHVEDPVLGEVQFNGPRAQAILSTLNQGQAQAVGGFWAHRIGVISGGAGVGKTYAMRAICEIAEENGLLVALCAPTGKAARKLAHSTSREARTIHRLLEPVFDENTGAFGFRRNPNYPIEASLVIVDEVSMVDVRLMRSLLLAMPADCRLLLVGDHHQIPSVGAGAILRDLLAGRASYPGAVHIMTEIVRQAGELAKNTTAILGGVVVRSTSPVWGLQATEKGGEEGAAALAAVLVESIVTSPEPLEPFGRPLDLAWDVQVLSPQRKGAFGTYALNVHLQKLRQRLLGNPPPEPVEPNDRPKPLAGDRVIWTKNDYTLDLFNGTQAIVLGFQKGGAMEIFTEDGRELTVPADKRSFVEVAYAMTIHKSQGSEWPCVILVGSSLHWNMHDRNLLYTGASRASESLTLLGDVSGLQHFAREQRSAARQTFGGFLVHGWKPKTALASVYPLALVEDDGNSTSE